MTINRLAVLLLVLAGGLSPVFFIPRNAKIQPCRINMDLPEAFDEWQGRPAEVTQKERDILATDTEFSRKLYSDPFNDEAYVSIVLSGQDLDNSIHRPERCLPAQGWTIVDSKSVNLPIPAAPNGSLPVTRLHNVRQATLDNNHVIQIYNLDYYWFVGYSDITASHFQREFIDIKDRLMHGYNQRWAYVTVSATITSNLSPYGKDEEQTDRMLQRIIIDLFPKIVGEPKPIDSSRVAAK